MRERKGRGKRKEMLGKINLDSFSTQSVYIDISFYSKSFFPPSGKHFPSNFSKVFQDNENFKIKARKWTWLHREKKLPLKQNIDYSPRLSSPPMSKFITTLSPWPWVIWPQPHSWFVFSEITSFPTQNYIPIL